MLTHADVFSGDGTHLFVLKNKLISLRRRYQGESVDGLHLFEITHGDDGVLECTFSAGALVDDVRNGGVNAPRARIRLNGSFHGGDGDLVYSHPGPYGEEEEVVVANVRHSLMEGHAVVKDDNTVSLTARGEADGSTMSRSRRGSISRSLAPFASASTSCVKR